MINSSITVEIQFEGRWIHLSEQSLLEIDEAIKMIKKRDKKCASI